MREVVSSDTACVRAALGIALREYPFGLFRVRSVCHFRKGLKSLHLFFLACSSNAAPLLKSGFRCPTPQRLLAVVAVSDLVAYSRRGAGEFPVRGMASLKASGTRIFSIGPDVISPLSLRGSRGGLSEAMSALFEPHGRRSSETGRARQPVCNPPRA